MNSGLELAQNSHPFLQSMPVKHLGLLSSCAVRHELEPGTLLIKEGEPAGQFYLIMHGSIAVEAHIPKDGSELVEVLGNGDVLGWSWMFPPFSWNFQARVMVPTEVIEFNAAHLLVAAERDHDFGYELMKRVAQVVIHRLQATRRQLMTARNPMAQRN